MILSPTSGSSIITLRKFSVGMSNASISSIAMNIDE